MTENISIYKALNNSQIWLISTYQCTMYSVLEAMQKQNAWFGATFGFSEVNPWQVPPETMKWMCEKCSYFRPDRILH